MPDDDVYGDRQRYCERCCHPTGWGLMRHCAGCGLEMDPGRDEFYSRNLRYGGDGRHAQGSIYYPYMPLRRWIRKDEESIYDDQETE